MGLVAFSQTFVACGNPGLSNDAQPYGQPDRPTAALLGSLRAGALRRPVTATFGVIVHTPMRRCMVFHMQLATGTVVGGKVIVEGDPLPEGAVVTILAREADETFEVPPELEAELLESIAQADRRETISAEEMLDRLRRIA